MAGSTSKLKVSKKSGKKAYSPRAFQQEAIRNSIRLEDDEPADAEFNHVHQELMAAANPTGDIMPSDDVVDDAEDILGVTRAVDVVIDYNTEYDSYCFKLDGGIEYNIVPNIYNENCQLAEDSAEMPTKGLLLEVQGRLVMGEPHMEIVNIVKQAQRSQLPLKMKLSPVDQDVEVPTIQDALRSTRKDELTVNILQHIRKKVHELTIPFTTRPIKPGEEEGVEYHFVHEAVFKKMIREGSFFEYSMKNGVYYGSPLVGEEDVEPGKTIERKASLKRKRSYDMLEEATVSNLLDQSEIAPELLSQLSSKTVDGEKASDLALSAFLESAGDSDLEDIREQVRNAVYEITVPLTTRAPREGEKDGREYRFVSVAEFKELIDQDRLLEYGLHNNALYGTLKVNKSAAAPLARTNRTDTLRDAYIRRHKGVKVGELLELSDASGSDELEHVADHSVAHFLASVPENDPVFGELRHKVKNWLYDCTVPYTTRPPRQTEIPGFDYHFVTEEEFQEMIENERFLEYGNVDGHWFGTLFIYSSDLKPRFSRSAIQHACGSRGAIRVQDILGDSPERFGATQVADFLKKDSSGDTELKEYQEKVHFALYDVTVPLTTRSLREGERHGRDYYFVTRDEFSKFCLEGKMLEFGVHNGELYGTLKPTLEEVADPTVKRSKLAIDQSEEITVDQIAHLLDNAPDKLARCTLTLSRFFAHVAPDDEELGAAREELKAVVYDMIIPYTTRDRRAGEREGQDYVFVTRDEFERLFMEDRFLEVGEVNGCYYGTPKVRRADIDPETRIPVVSKKRLALSWLVNPRGEVMMDYFIENFGMKELADVAEVPLSLYLARIDVADVEQGQLRDRIMHLVYEKTIPVTSRPRREGEKDGREYHFVSEEEFVDMIQKHKLLEYGRKSNGFYYGTPLVLDEHLSVEKPYSRSASMLAVHEAKQKHVKLNDILAPGAHPDLSTLGNMSVSTFLSKVDLEHDQYAQLRELVKERVYALTTPYTTRPKRAGEEDGILYHFVTKPVFRQMVDDDKFLEWGEHKGELYGTPHVYEEDVAAGIDAAISKQRQRRSKVMALSQSSGDRQNFVGLEDAIKREEALQRRVDAVKTALASKDDVPDDDLRLLVDKLHAIVHADESMFAESTDDSDAVAGPAEPERVASPVLIPTKVKVQDAEEVESRKTIEEQKAKLDELEARNLVLEAQAEESKEFIGALKIQAKVKSIDETLSGLDKLDELLKSLPNLTSAPAQTAAPPNPQPLPTVASGAGSAWNGNRGPMSIKEKLAARRHWQQAEAAVTMSPLKAKLAARRKAKSGGGISSTGNGTPALGMIAASLMSKKSTSDFAEPDTPRSTMQSKSISPASPRHGEDNE